MPEQKELWPTQGKIVYRVRGVEVITIPMPVNRILLPIKPKPFLAIPPNTKVFNIPERCTYVPSLQRHRRRNKEDGTYEEIDIRLLGCELWNNTGFCRHTLSKHNRNMKKRIIKYNDYKRALRALADQAGLKLQVSGWSIYFYFPIPVRWSKKKKAVMHGQFKVNKPDYDNLCKGVGDSVGKRRGEQCDRFDDEIIAQLSGTGKFWFDPDKVDPWLRDGYIEVLLNQPLYNPFGVTFIKQ